MGFVFIDPYLNPWDEQYHALVAKNLTKNPFLPVLFDGPVNLSPDYWVYTDVWLHKQPLFLWQMALSIQIFGAKIWAVRLPSVIMHACASLATYSLAKRTLTSNFSILAVGCYLFSGYLNDFTSGAQGMEHNDAAFFCYCILSIWMLFRYLDAPTMKKACAVGLFVAFAVLVKWLVGLFAFGLWGFYLFSTKKWNKTQWFHLLMAFSIVLLLAGSWQVFCWINFPIEFKLEMKYNSRHIFEPIEGHTGNAFFYWKNLNVLYGNGDLMPWLLVLGFCIAFYKGFFKRDRFLQLSSLGFLIIYLFFTLCATKMEGFTVIVAPLGFIFLILPIQEFVRIISLKYTFLIRLNFGSSFFILFFLMLQLSPKGVLDRHFFYDTRLRDETKATVDNAVNEIIKSGNHKFYLLKGLRSPYLPAIRFLTNKWVYMTETPVDSDDKVVLDVSDMNGKLEKNRNE